MQDLKEGDVISETHGIHCL